MSNDHIETLAEDGLTRNEVSRGRAWAIVLLLTFLYGFASLDRQMMSLLAVPIKQDLKFSDMQIGLLQGGAFALFFVLASLPVGWLVDRISRRAIIFWGMIIWSLCAAGSGLSKGFAQMFASRAGVGAGEATLQPAAFATIAEVFPAERLSLPLSVFVLGANIGSGLSFIIGGIAIKWVLANGVTGRLAVNGLHAWQYAFLFTGLPGLAIAFLVFAIPRASIVVDDGKMIQCGYLGAWRHYRSHLGFYILHNLGFACCIAYAIGLLSWNPTFLARKYGLNFGETGLLLGSTQIITSVLALSFHGRVVDWLFRRRIYDAHVRWYAVMCPLAGLFAAIAYLVNNLTVMLLLYNIGFFCMIGYPGIGAAALQIATPAALRGKISAVYLIVLNLVGATSGPLIIAAITQYVLRDENSIGIAMSVAAALVTATGALCFGLAMRPMRLVIAPSRGGT